MGERLLTTGQVAKLFHVAPRTASKWFDSGKIQGWRLPGSLDRRVPISKALAFAREHGIALGEVQDDLVATALVLTHDDALAARVEEALQPGGWLVVRCRETFEAGVRTTELRPRVVLVDLDVGRVAASVVAQGVAEWRARAGVECRTIVIGAAGTEVPPLFDAYVALSDVTSLRSVVGDAPIKSAWPRRKATAARNGQPTEVVVPS